MPSSEELPILYNATVQEFKTKKQVTENPTK